jgi:hypothetical protein
MTLPTYNGMPPASPPHKPANNLASKAPSWTPRALFKKGDSGFIIHNMFVTINYKDGKLESVLLGPGSNEEGTILYPKPTPIIPQMVDKIERDTFAVEAMGWLHWATCWAAGISITGLLVSLLYQLTFGGF